VKKIVLLFIFGVSLFGQMIGSEFLKIEKDTLRITDETKFAAYLKSLDDKDIIEQYREILKPIDLFGEAQASLVEVASYEQAFKNLRLIYSKLYLKDRPQNIDKQVATLKEKQAAIVSLLFSLQSKNLYDTDVIPIIFEYRKIDRKLLEFEIEKESLLKSKDALIAAIVKKNLRFDNDNIDLKSKIASLEERMAEQKKESAAAKSDAKKELIELKSSLLSFRLKSYEMKSDFFEKIRLLKKIKSSKESQEERRKLDDLLSKSYEPIYFAPKEASPKNNELFAEYESEKATFEALRNETKLDSQVFERVFKSFDDSLPARTTGYFESIYEFFGDTMNATLFISNNADIKVKTIITVLMTLVFIYVFKVWLTLKAIPAYFERAYRDGGHSEHIRFIVSKIANISAYIVMFFVLLGGFGLSLTNFAIIVSALSVGIGFGLQGVVSNFISGIILLFENSIKIGDILSLPDGRTGVVTSVNLRTTNIRTYDDIDILIPNSSVFSGQIENLTKDSTLVRRRVKFTVGYDTDTIKLQQILDKKTKELLGDNFIEGTKLLVTGYGNYGIDIEYRVFVDLKKQAAEIGDFLKEFLDALMEGGIEIPYPKLEIIKFEGNLK
jgi:small-conductance mechanosensitive channel